MKRRSVRILVADVLARLVRVGLLAENGMPLDAAAQGGMALDWKAVHNWG